MHVSSDLDSILCHLQNNIRVSGSIVHIGYTHLSYYAAAFPVPAAVAILYIYVYICISISLLLCCIKATCVCLYSIIKTYIFIFHHQFVDLYSYIIKFAITQSNLRRSLMENLGCFCISLYDVIRSLLLISRFFFFCVLDEFSKFTKQHVNMSMLILLSIINDNMNVNGFCV